MIKKILDNISDGRDAKIRKALKVLSDSSEYLISSVAIANPEAEMDSIIRDSANVLSKIFDAFNVPHELSFVKQLAPEEHASEGQESFEIDVSPADLSLVGSLNMAVDIRTAHEERISMKYPENTFKVISETVMTNGDKCIYNNPKLNGEMYEVALVGRNRDYIIGVMDGVNASARIACEVDKALGVCIKRWMHDMNPFSSYSISSIHGTEMNLTDDDIEMYRNHFKETYEMVRKNLKGKFDENGDEIPNHSEIETDISKYAYLDLRCPHCGMVHQFSQEEIPSESVKCSSCDRLMLEYTGVHINQFIYNSHEEPDGTDTENMHGM